MEEDLLDILVPIQPSDSSIQSHIAALDLLAARLSILTSQTRLPARIPLNSKASFSGSVIHTNDVKVIVGGECWVEMTAEEAVGYVRRRKNALLVEHARLQEGARRDISTTGVSENEVAGPSPRTAFPPTIHLNPLFGRSAVAGPTRHPAAPAIIESSAQEKSSEPDTLARSGPVAASKAESSLADVLDEFVETQRVLANDTGKRKGRVSKEEAAMINEEGLPIHEIREDTDGRPLGAIPTKPSDVQDEALAPLDVEKPADDFWSEAAVARRAALRRRIFHEGDNGDDEGDQPQLSAEPEEFADPTTPSIPSTPIRPPSPICRPSPTSQPKSILKQSARKKSVSFDESVPIPPDSPDHSGMSARIGGVVLPMPNGEFEPRPVPVIAEPKPAVKSQVGEKGFAGFKRGFLGGPSKPKTTTAALRTGPRKSSLFAQRMAQPEEELPSPTASATTVISMSSAETRPTVNLPKMSESKQMASMKPAVIERAVSRPSEPETTTTTSIASSSNASIARNGNTSHPVDTDQDEEDDYDDPSDEDEYDFDDALLAREAALEFHRRRGYQSFNPDDPDEEGGVMLALPQIADGKRIVNPTPDDPRKFVRVGKLENGKLVLAPGQVGWSDSEDEGDGDGEVDAEKREGRGRKREMKRRLLGLEGDEPPIRAAEAKSHVEEETLPPAVTPIVREANKPTQSNPSPSLASPAPPPDPAPAKKVSRFKAARMGI